MTEPRITPGTRKQVGLVNWAIAAVSGRVAGTGPPNIFLTLARHRRLYRGWLHFAGRMMPGGTLPRRDTELVILRVAHRRRCAYEFDHHAHLGAKAGLTEADVERVRLDVDQPGWSERDRLLLSVVDALEDDHDLDDDLWAVLRDRFDERSILELLLLVGHYQMLATTITTLRVQPDPPR